MRTLQLCRASAGTGKTYTLTHKYVDLLLKHGQSYRSILAITFTNKATAEMKERILTLLLEESRSNSVYQERAKALFKAVLEDFDNLHVMTIDSFLQSLMRGLALKLEKAAGYSVDLDLEHALTTAVDQIMTSHIDEQEGLREVIMQHLSYQLSSAANWDFRAGTIKLAKQLFVESVQKAESEGQVVFDRDKIEAYIKELNDLIRAEKDDIATQRLKVTAEHLNDMILLSYVRHQINANQAANNSILLANTAAVLKRELQTGDADFILEKAGIRYKHILIDEFQDTSDLQWYSIVALVKEILAGGGTTLIVGDVKQSIYRWRNGNWHIMEELGENDDLKPYLAPPSPATTLVKSRRSCREVVRFNLETFRRIAAQYHFYDEGYNGANLEDYYLAGEHEGGYVEMRYYPRFIRKNKDYPELTTALQQKAMVHDMFQTIETLLAHESVRPQDILILLRNNRSNDLLSSVYDELMQNGEAYPHLRQHKPVSGDSYRLESSTAVQVIIAALRYIADRDEASIYLIKLYEPSAPIAELATIDPAIPLTMLIEEVISICLCPEGQYKGEDIAYINAFRDKAQGYVTRYGSDLKQFLQYWSDTLHDDAIPTVNAGEIRVMTIHSSKGLEAPFVFIPFCSWPMEEDGKHQAIIWGKPSVHTPNALPLIPLTNKKDLLTAGYEELYQEEHAEERIDNTNLLYVAFTRAAQHLYIYCDKPLTVSELKPKKKEATADIMDVASLLLDAYQWREELLNTVRDFPEKGVRYLIKTQGEPTIYPPKTKTATDEPFAFNNATPISASFYCNTRSVQFRQSKEAIDFVSSDKYSARDFGSLCHDILSHIILADDLSRVISAYWANGDIDSLETKEHIEAQMQMMFAHPEVADWFSGRYKVYMERTILAEQEQRPDRVMVMGKKAIVLDYKFGTHELPVHLRQVSNYMRLMKQLGYEEVEGYLYYAEKDYLKPVKLS